MVIEVLQELLLLFGLEPGRDSEREEAGIAPGMGGKHFLLLTWQTLCLGEDKGLPQSPPDKRQSQPQNHSSTSMDTIVWFTIFSLLIIHARSQVTEPNTSDCPKDIVRQAMGCFSDLASGVTEGRSSPFTGSMPLDYHMIREYCQEGGHMTRFLQCIDNLQKQCQDAAEAEVLLQIINPERVRTSVPNLCKNVDLVEKSADCLNREMTQESTCKNSAKDMIKKGMAETPRNVTAMFIVQCRFFNILAECQRTSVKDTCGQTLADLHADFILSFVPNTCANENITLNYEDEDEDIVSTGDVTTKKSLHTSEETATMLGVYPSKKQTNSKDSLPSDKKPKDKAQDTPASKIPEVKVPEQVLKTLPPFLDEDDKLGLKSKRHLDDDKDDDKKETSSGASTILSCVGLLSLALIFL